MSTIAEFIASVANPTPKELDPEDDVNIETVPKIKTSSNTDGEAVYTVSELRSKTAPLLEDLDPTYAGRKVSRKSLDNIFQDDENTYVKNSGDSEDLLSENENSDCDSDEEDSDEGISDGDLENFKSLVKNQEVISAEEDSEQEEESVESEQSDISEDIESSGDMVNKFANIDVTSEAEKGAAVKAQLDLWNRLCESRIKLQKLLIIANKLPQSDCWEVLKTKGGEEVTESLKKGSNSVKLLLNNCLNLQTELLERNPETNNIDGNDQKKSSNDDDEEIPSNTDEEMELQENEINKTEIRGIKRKLKCEEYSKILAKRHKSLIPYRNSVIQKWDEKTRLSFGRVTQKSFSAFDSSALKKIEQVLQDESRLIKRTQLKRSLYRVLGKPDATDLKPQENAEASKPVSKQDMLLRDYDPEIYDDDDFYGQLLKDIIESKSVGMNPAVVRKQMEIQSIRNKMKRKVDTKASKGRKIRYDIHPKLVNFMAPVETTTISDEARDNLLKCLFGRNSNKSS